PRFLPPGAQTEAATSAPPLSSLPLEPRPRETPRPGDTCAPAPPALLDGPPEAAYASAPTRISNSPSGPASTKNSSPGSSGRVVAGTAAERRSPGSAQEPSAGGAAGGSAAPPASGATRRGPVPCSSGVTTGGPMLRRTGAPSGVRHRQAAVRPSSRPEAPCSS